MIKIEVGFFYPLHRPSMKEPAKIYYSTCVQIHRRYTDYHTVWNQYHRNAHLMQQIYDIYSNRFNYITLNIYNVSLFKINDCCMKYAWEVFLWVPQQVFSPCIDVTFKVQRLYGSRHINGVPRQMGGVECQLPFVSTIPVTVYLWGKCTDTLCKIIKQHI